MRSLYDLLGARENDDADALKKAFRRAIKANHPDLHPGDPDAAERFKEIIVANACLRDPKTRATYDLLLQRERQGFQTPMLKRQQRRSKRMRATGVIAVVSALIGGYGLWATMPTTSDVRIDKDEPAAAAGAAVERDRQTAIVVASENPTVIAAAKVDGLRGSVHNAGKPVMTTGAPTGALDQAEPRGKHDESKPRTDKHDDAQIPIGANELSDDAAAIVRFVMQRLHDGGDAQVTAGRELARGPAASDKHDDTQIPIGANELSDDAAAIVRFVMQRLRDGGGAQATAGPELALGPPANDANFYRERGIAAYGSLPGSRRQLRRGNPAQSQ
jgi:curved DNA-binding protein CbpA